MREIKFRAWTNNCWINEGMLYNYQDTTYVEILGFNDDKLILMQFTGLKDKNGVDIYEGDIFHCNKVNYVLKYLTSGGAYTVHNIKDNSDERFLHHCNTQIEIIGNIYQNPELIMK